MIYDNDLGRNVSRTRDGQIALDKLDPFTIKAVAQYMMEKPDDMNRQNQMRTFVARCDGLDDLVRELYALGWEG